MARKAHESIKIADGLPPDEIFLTALHRSLIYSIFSMARCKGESLTYAEAEKLLTSNGAGADIATEAASLLNQIESARYGGMNLGNNEKQELLSRTQKVARRLCR